MSFLDARIHGSKPGSGFLSLSQENVDRRERLRRLAIETVDLDKDPYFMRNHLGQYECKLCLTLHLNEGSYLSHTQGKRHQQNLLKRSTREAQEKKSEISVKKHIECKKEPRIGRPGYRVTKQFDKDTKQRSLLFQIDYPEIKDDHKPCQRFMSAYEQRKEATDRKFQYVLFHAQPYEIIAFKVPSYEVDQKKPQLNDKTLQNTRLNAIPRKELFFTHWDSVNKIYTLQVTFKITRTQKNINENK